MKIYNIIIVILFIPFLISGAEWRDYSLEVTGSGQSDEAGSTRYVLKDKGGMEFGVNYSTPPEERHMKRIVELKEIFYSWKLVHVEKLEFFSSPDSIFTAINTGKITYMGENLSKYIPAGLAFQDTRDGLYYRFRIVVEYRSYMIEGVYTNEDTFLQKIYAFIRKQQGIEEPGGDVRQDEPEKMKTSHRISVCTFGSYIVPTAKLADRFTDGYGCMAGITIHDMGISFTDKTLFHLDFTLAGGYQSLNADDSLSRKATVDIDNAYVIPVSLAARYNINIYRGLFAAPGAGTGLNYNCIDYTESRSDGSYKKMEIRAWAPSLSAEFMLGYNIIENKLAVIAGAEYGAMFERHMTIQSARFHLGAEYSFILLGK